MRGIFYKKDIDVVEFCKQMEGFVSAEESREIYKNIEHFSYLKKSVIIDLLRSNVIKYKRLFLDNMEWV